MDSGFKKVFNEFLKSEAYGQQKDWSWNVLNPNALTVKLLPTVKFVWKVTNMICVKFLGNIVLIVVPKLEDVMLVYTEKNSVNVSPKSIVWPVQPKKESVQIVRIYLPSAVLIVSLRSIQYKFN